MENNKKKIIAVVAQKGGVSKTTVAINIALYALLIAKIKAKLIDCDFDQYSSTEVMLIREKHNIVPALQVEAMSAADVEKTIELVYEENDLILLECGGRNDEETKTAMMLADTIVSLTSRSMLDVKTLKNLERLIEESGCQKKEIILIPSMISAHPRDNDLKELREIVGPQLKYFKFSKNHISRRKVFYQSFDTGRAVFEMKGKYKNAAANFEIKQIFEELWTINQ